MWRRYSDVSYGSMRMRLVRIILAAESFKLSMIEIMAPMISRALMVPLVVGEI